MTMLAIIKFINVSKRQKGTTVHLLIPLDWTDVFLFSVSRPGSAVGRKRKKKKSQLRIR